MVNQPNVWNPNKIVRISEVLVFELKLVPNDFRLSEIRISSDFGIPLYSIHVSVTLEEMTRKFSYWMQWRNQKTGQVW